MNRRALLEELAAIGAIASIGGCLSRKSIGQEQSTNSTQSTEGSTCPSFTPDSDRTICADRATTAEQPVYLTADPQPFTISTNDQTVEILKQTVHNQSEHSFVVNQGAWMIMRRTDNDWSKSAAGNHTEQSITVAPGATHTWSLSLISHPSPRTTKNTFITANLEEGTYIFSVIGKLQQSDQPQQIECQSQFNLVKKETH